MGCANYSELILYIGKTYKLIVFGALVRYNMLIILLLVGFNGVGFFCSNFRWVFYDQSMFRVIILCALLIYRGNRLSKGKRSGCFADGIFLLSYEGWSI